MLLYWGQKLKKKNSHCDFGLDTGRTCSYCQMVIPQFILPQSFCQPLKRLPWRQWRGGEGSSDSEQNLIIGRLSEDRGYCSPCRRFTALPPLTTHTHRPPSTTHPLCVEGKSNKGRNGHNKQSQILWGENSWSSASHPFSHNSLTGGGLQIARRTDPDSQQGQWHYEGDRAPTKQRSDRLKRQGCFPKPLHRRRMSVAVGQR